MGKVISFNMKNLQPIVVLCVSLGYLLAHARHIPNDAVLSREELQEYSRDGSAIQEFDIISPQYISNGVFKRSTESIQAHHPSIQEVQYNAFDTSFSLKLKHNDWLVRQGLQVEILKADGTIERKPLGTTNCHYFGTVSGQESSAAAISLCNGMHGMISHNNTDYVIQPLKNHHAHKIRSRRDVDEPHIIYKRSVTAPTDNDEDYEEKHHPFCSYEAPVGYHPTLMPYINRRPGPKAISQQLPHVGQKYLELFVVADKDMADFHGDNTEDYVFALMNVVSRRYADPSLDITLRIHIVKFMIFESDSPTLHSSTFDVSGSASTLDDFCAWQAEINPFHDSHPEHWDNAILLTRKNLYTDFGSGRDYSLLGKAYLSSTCRRGLQCSFNQDDGLGSSLVIAHETGHTLGLSHDDDYGCMSGLHIMSSWRPAGTDSFTWSTCSRENIRTFLGGPVSTCLDDVPSNSPLPVDELVGATYDLDEQCALALGPGASTCQRSIINCGYLRCRNSTGCFSLGVGVMDGTACGNGQWCMSGSCVVKEPLPDAVDGGWSDWGLEYGECSRTCGGGVRMRRRYCNNPTPRYGGRSCVGSAEQYEACNLTPCETSQDDFRDEQCADTNDILFNGHNYTWRAFITGQTGNDLCTKKCLSNNNFWANRPPYEYVDGTRCWHGDNSDSNSLKLCVSGKCQQFGCDGVQGSGAVFDVCRRCNGDGSSCELITGQYDGGRYRRHTTFLHLPVGATSVEINNTNLAYTHMALSTDTETVFEGYLFTPPSAGRYTAGSNIIQYSTDFRSFREKITIEGPLSIPMTVEVYLLYDPRAIYGVNVRPKISYDYYVPLDQPVYEWQAGQYGECSVTCGEGEKTRRLRCVLMENNRPTEVGLNNCDQDSRPPSTELCDEGPCPAPAEWVKGAWSECDVECGEGYETRVVHCQRGGQLLPPGECSGDAPRDRRRCNAGECLPPPSWFTGSWSECDVTCENGQQTRKVQCRRGDRVTPGECDVSNKPTPVRSCDAGPCPNWVAGQWGECDVPCGIGIQRRAVECRTNRVVTEGVCDNTVRPPVSRECDAGDCLAPAEWVTGEWTECNVDCGFGTKYRSVTCQRGGEDVAKGECDQSSKPRSKAPCQLDPCELPAKWITGPWRPCDAPCGIGTESRFVGCLQGKVEVASELCDPGRRPNDERPCVGKPCVPEWETGPWSECSVSCGEGTQTREIRCERRGNEVTKKNCDQNLKPHKSRTCNQGPCRIDAEWTVGDWSECSQTCGEGTRERSVECQRGNDLAPNDCNQNGRPVAVEECFVVECPPPARWTVSSWSTCSASCGGGTQTRDVRCMREVEQVDDTECLEDDLPKTQRGCNIDPCPTLAPAVWVTGDWSQCNADCGRGTQTRSVSCQREGIEVEGACATDTRPEEERTCESGPCDRLENEGVNPENEICNQLLTGPAGSYSQSHPTGEFGCTTTLVAPFGKSFSLRINSIINCTIGEYLKIKEGTRKINLCGHKNDYLLDYNDNVISISLKTVSGNSGYALSYERKDGTPANRCDRLFLSPSGTIKSPSYPMRYPSRADCRYRIVTEPGNQIRVAFSRFSLQGHYPTCRYDKLEITDIVSGNRHKYCGTRNQLSLVSTGNDILMRFRTDSRNNFSGFRATYGFV